MNIPDDAFDWYMGYDADEDAHKHRVQSRAHRKARTERRELAQARKAVKR